MPDFDFAAAAEKLAHVAVLGNTATLAPARVKKAIDWSQLLNNPTAQRYLDYLRDPTVQRYLVGGLGGAALGAGIGALQPQRKGRNSLLYGLMGGLSGLSAAHLTHALSPNTMPRTRKEIEDRIAQLQKNKTTDASNEAGKAFTATIGQNLLPTAERTGQAAVGGGVGLLAGRGGRRATTALGNAITPTRLAPKDAISVYRSGARSRLYDLKHRQSAMQAETGQALAAVDKWHRAVLERAPNAQARADINNWRHSQRAAATARGNLNTDAARRQFLADIRQSKNQTRNALRMNHVGGWTGAVLRGVGATLPYVGALGGAIGGAGAQELAHPFIVPPETNQK